MQGPGSHETTVVSDFDHGNRTRRSPGFNRRDGTGSVVLLIRLGCLAPMMLVMIVGSAARKRYLP